MPWTFSQTELFLLFLWLHATQHRCGSCILDVAIVIIEKHLGKAARPWFGIDDLISTAIWQCNIWRSDVVPHAVVLVCIVVQLDTIECHDLLLSLWKLPNCVVHDQDGSGQVSEDEVVAGFIMLLGDLANPNSRLPTTELGYGRIWRYLKDMLYVACRCI